MAAEFSVTVIAAREADWAGDADPYVVLKYHGKTHKTKADKNGGSNPSWNKTFTFPLAYPVGTMEVKVYDDDVGMDEFKGQTSVDLSDIQSAGHRASRWYPLHKKNASGSCGEIQLDIAITYSEGYSEESAAELASLQKKEDGAEFNQLLAGAAGLAAAGVAAYAGSQAATGKNQTTNTVIAGVAGAAALAAGGFAVSEHIKENKLEKDQEALGEKKHGWFD